VELVSTALSSGCVFLSFFRFLFHEQNIGLNVAGSHGLILLSLLFCMSHHTDSWVVICWGIIFCGVIWLYEIFAVFSTWANMPFNLSVKHYICHKNHVWVYVCVCVWWGAVIRWPLFISAWPPFWQEPYSHCHTPWQYLLLMPSSWHHYISHISNF